MYASLCYRIPQNPSVPPYNNELAVMISNQVSTSSESTPPESTKNETQKPKKFDGENQTADWLMLFDLAAKGNEWDAKQRLNYMPSFFEGAAMTWHVNRIMRMSELSGENDDEVEMHGDKT